MRRQQPEAQPARICRNQVRTPPREAVAGGGGVSGGVGGRRRAGLSCDAHPTAHQFVQCLLVVLPIRKRRVALEDITPFLGQRQRSGSSNEEAGVELRAPPKLGLLEATAVAECGSRRAEPIGVKEHVGAGGQVRAHVRQRIPKEGHVGIGKEDLRRARRGSHVRRGVRWRRADAQTSIRERAGWPERSVPGVACRARTVACSPRSVRSSFDLVRPICVKPGLPHLASSAPISDLSGKHRAAVRACGRPSVVASSVAPTRALLARWRASRCSIQFSAKSSCAWLANVVNTMPAPLAAAAVFTSCASSGRHGAMVAGAGSVGAGAADSGAGGCAPRLSEEVRMARAWLEALTAREWLKKGNSWPSSNTAAARPTPIKAH